MSSTRRHGLHAILVTGVVVLFTLAVGLYVASIALAPTGGNDVAGLFDGWAMFAMIAGIAVGIVDFFVRPQGGRSGDAGVRGAAVRRRAR